MPMEFRTVLQQNRHILHGIPAMGAEAVQQWAKARYGVRLVVLLCSKPSVAFSTSYLTSTSRSQPVDCRNPRGVGYIGLNMTDGN